MADETEKKQTPPKKYEPDPLYDHRTGKLMKRNKRGELVEDRSDKPGSDLAEGTDFDPFTGKD